MPDCKGYNSLVIARDNFFSWAKAKQIKNLISKKVAKFIYYKIICRYKLFRRLKVNRELKFKGKVI